MSPGDDDFFSRIGAPFDFLEALERAIAARKPVRAIGCMPRLQGDEPDCLFPYAIIAAIDDPRHLGAPVLTLDEVIREALEIDVGLGVMNVAERFTTLTYGHLWSYVATGKLLVPPPPPPDGYAPDPSRFRYWSPNAEVFPDPARKVLRSLLAQVTAGRPPKALLFTDDSTPWFTSFAFNVYSDELDPQTATAVRMALRWHIPAHLSVSLCRSQDPIAARFEHEVGF